MNRPRGWLVLPVLLASAVSSSSIAAAAEIRDKAKLFSPEAVEKAQAELDRVEKKYEVPVTIETINTLDGDTIKDVTTRHARAVRADGLYLMIAKQESKIFCEASSFYQDALPRDRLKAIDDAFIEQFKKRDFDAGLTQGVAKMGTVFGDAKVDAGGSLRKAPNAAKNNRRAEASAPVRQQPAPNRPQAGGSMFGGLIAIVLGILALMFVFRIIGAIMRAMSGGNSYQQGGMMGGRGYGPGGPGYGGPGYGGGYGGAPAGGGGFMSSLFGGIGGAMAGNYLYDRMTGGHQGGGSYGEQAAYGGEAAPVENATPEWGAGGAEADYGGGAAVDNSGGGDWGGGGGGDWGGGDSGGGDWGGGGDDNGGSW